MLLGLCRSRGGFSAALLLLSGSFGLAAPVGLPLLWVAREQRLYGSGLPEGLSVTACRRGCDGLFTVQACRDVIESGREAVLGLVRKKADVPLPLPNEEGGAQNGDYVLVPKRKSGETEGDTRGAFVFPRCAPPLLCARLVIALVVAFGLGLPVFFGVLRTREDTPTHHTASGAGGGVQVVGSDGPRDAGGVSHSYWSLKPSDPPAYAAAVGGTLVFRYSASHNVWRMPSAEAFEACDFSAATELAGVAYGGVAAADVARLGYANVYEAHLDAAGTVYFACQVGDHCAKGQKIAVAVSDGK